MLSAENNHERCVKVLRCYEATIQGKENRTALMYAAQAGSLECVKVLASIKCEILSTDKNEWTALMYAAKSNHPECIPYLH